MNRSKAKGTLFEREVANFLTATFPNADRKALRGNQDQGDITGVPGWTLELKSTRELDLAAAVDEARVEAINAGTIFYASIHKRRRRSIGEAYVVMPLSLFVAVLRELAN